VKHFSLKALVMAVLVCGWLGATGWGMWRLAAYSLAPGSQGVAPQHWPADSKVAGNSSGFTAVVALHPECPCSQATLEELDSIVAQGGGRLHVQVLFAVLPGLPPVEDSALWKRASRIAGVGLIKDAAGAEARRFGVRTSGETRLYGPDGRLLFRGGITGARGHVGDNPGQTAIVTLLTQRLPAATPVAMPVFGCALWNDGAKTP
jgi:hypothetical protein